MISKSVRLAKMKHSPFGGCFVFITEIDFEFAVSGFCYAIFQGAIQKISFPKNELWVGLELNTWAFRGRFCDYFRRVCPFFRFNNY